MSAQEPDGSEPSESETGAWPVWEVQGYGTVTTAGDPLVGPARREIRPPWVDIRLTFADGARIDVLAVVHDGRIAIEDAQADPPLALEGFAALAGVIEAPLQDACKVVAGQDAPPAPEPLPAPEPWPTPEPAAVEPPVLDVSDPPTAAPSREPELEPEPEAEPPEGPGRHRADPAASRGATGRRTVADIYRAAQRDGLDPVLAVMSATGFSRRKSLRLIAGARDEGHLSPRHHRR
ncbi:DUF6214 family protein [Streptomyces sp. NPDC087420]|uniref:DUF6214 family protein n=1 Tax=Streptomyces sp. NPDC087420 TaxID=3365785 RepID=UPI0038333B55